MELVTGRKGTPHITSQQDRMKNQGIWGDQVYILNTGQMLEPQVQSSNEIRIRDGALMAQGALSCVKVNSYDSVTIQNGSQGMKRIDLICWQYTYDADQDVESAEWVVIQGTPAASDPQQPTYTEGDIQQGDELVQVPIFAVHLDGINVTGVDVIPEVMPDIPTLNADLAELSTKTSGYTYSTDETVIGKWIDGRNLYRKVFNVGTLTSGTSTTRAHNIANFDRAIHLYGGARNTSVASRYTIGYPYPSVNGTSMEVSLQANNTEIQIYHPSGSANYSAVVVMEYIKTAD